ncbi:MAG: GNAT family N-acetyltransferase [Flavobacteriaceae bacterium]
MKDLSIIQYHSNYAKDFATLNYEWLKKYFVIEPHDTEMLENPETYIINNGGYILFAKTNNKIVGTVALIQIQKEYYELAKMAVTEQFQGKQIGRLLLEATIEFAKTKGIKTLMLESNRTLKAALHLYNTYGFEEVPTDPNSPYERADIKMELHL